MPHFHAAFSGGTVVSALLGSAMSWGGVPLTAHFLGAGAVTVASPGGPSGLPAALRGAPRGGPGRPQPAPLGLAGAAHPAHRCRRLRGRLHRGHRQRLAAVAFVEGHELPAWAGVLGFATFLTFMTIARLVGTGCSTATAGCPCSTAASRSPPSARRWSSSVPRGSRSPARRSGVSVPPGLPGRDERVRRRRRSARPRGCPSSRRSATSRSSPDRRCSASSATGSACSHSLLVVGALAVLALAVSRPSASRPRGPPTGRARPGNGSRHALRTARSAPLAALLSVCPNGIRCVSSPRLTLHR